MDLKVLESKGKEFLLSKEYKFIENENEVQEQIRLKFINEQFTVYK